MTTELNSSLESLTTTDIREIQCCASARRVKWLKNKGAILIVVWSYLVGSVFHLLRAGYKDKVEDYVSNTGIILLSSTLLYPVGGWLADTRLGRYAVIRYSMWIMWIGSLLLTFNEVLSCINFTYSTVRMQVFASLSIVMAIALGGFLSNIVQLGIDQLMDASATEITSFITWYTLTLFTSGVTFHYISDCVQDDYQMLYVKPGIVAFCLTIALCSNFFFQHWLVKEQVAGKSLRIIFNVIKYTVRNRKFKYNYLSDDKPLSPFDIAKHRYGGPFTAQQVENVRTFLWLIGVIALSATICGIPTPLAYAQDKMMRNVNITDSECYTKVSIHYFDFILVVVLMFLFEFVLLPLCSKCLPRVSIINMFILGEIGILLWIISLLIIEVVAYEEKLYPGTCIFTEASKLKVNYKLFLIPKSLQGLAILLFVLSSLKFIWSQAPSTMKGMVLGFGYSFLGLSSLLHTAIASPFIFHKPVTVSWEHVKLTCGVWYLLMEGTIILVTVIIIIIVVQRYKKRNEHTIYDSYRVSVSYA